MNAEFTAKLMAQNVDLEALVQLQSERIAELEKDNKELHAIAQRMAMSESDARKSLQSYRDAEEKQNE